MDIKSKIIDILLDNFHYIYCESCEYQDTNDCYECHRKYMGWSLSSETAVNIADEIMKIFEN